MTIKNMENAEKSRFSRACEIKTMIMFVFIRDCFDISEHWMYYLASKFPKSRQMAQK